MTSREIFEALCACRNPDVEGGMAPNQLATNGVKMIDIEDRKPDVISHTEYYGDDGGKVVEIYESYDHSRTFELRPDSNHFYISLYDEQGQLKDNAHHVYWDKM